MRRYLRLIAAGTILATSVMSGVVVGPGPEPARAALLSVGVDDSLSMKHDRTAVVAAPGVLANDIIVGTPNATLVAGVTHGTLSLRSDGGYTYTPAAGYVGLDTFRYKPSTGLSTAAAVTITITNAAPVARPDAYSGAAGTSIMVAAPGVLANDTDADGDALTTQLVGGITGSLNLNPNGGFSWTPPGGFSGTATFDYRVWDGVVWSSTTAVSLTISAATPTPTPSPTPTPAPTPLPTPSIPVSPLPTIGSSLVPSPTPTGRPDDSGTPLPGAAGRGSGPTASGSESAPPSAQSPGAGGSRSGAGLHLAAPALDLGVGTISILAGLETWAVPAAVMGGPGLLVLLWIALQAIGATVWVPAARRLRDDDGSMMDRRRLSRSG